MILLERRQLKIKIVSKPLFVFAILVEKSKVTTLYGHRGAGISPGFPKGLAAGVLFHRH